MTKRRNPLGNLAILGKGGVHSRAQSAKRAAEKHALNDEIDKWYEEDEILPSNKLDGQQAIEPSLKRGDYFLSAR